MTHNCRQINSKMWKKPTKHDFPLFFFFFLCIVSLCTGMDMAQSDKIGVKVGVVLDMETWMGKMGFSCIQMALTDFYASHPSYKTRLILNTRDSKRDVVRAAAAALDLLKNAEVQAIIGPSSSMQAHFIIELGNKAEVPIISFSATSPSLTSIRSRYFIRSTTNDSSQVGAISAIVKAFGWRSVVPIYEDNEYGEGIIPFLTDALQDIDVHVPYRSIIPTSASDDQITAELYKLLTMQTRVFIVHMWSILGSRFFTIAKENGMMDDKENVWIITDGLTNLLSSMENSVIDSMQGVLGVTPYIPQTEKRQNFTNKWKRKFQQDNPLEYDARLNVFGLWAYDAATALAIAIEVVGESDLGYQKTITSTNSTDLETFGVSRNGQKLVKALLNSKFNGLTGPYRIIDGQLQPSAYEIVNVIGNGGRRIGFWTPENGIVRKLNSANTTTNLSSKHNFGAIIWPGETTTPPKGWVIPVVGKKLRVGVPVKDGFSEFVRVRPIPGSNTSKVEGYCIAVFEAVLAALPYAVSYEYIPFATPNGKSAGTYNDMLYQLYFGNFDAVVGDTTIVADRSKYVDFTLPYTESGVALIVPIKDDRRKNAWVFLKPLTWDLWVTSFCSFVLFGFVIWVLEHRINDDFRGPPAHQVGMIFWFSFSTMVFAHREKVLSNLARFVVIIWIFVVLILTQSYTASLTSMLTVQQLQPTVTDMKELLNTSFNVGYQEGSFTLGMLKRKGFDDSRLKVFNSPEELEELFTNKSSNGSIAAAFDEIPYMKLFLARYCSKYTMIEPTFKTDGFGFAFPIGSPLVPDVSRAILEVTEGEKMGEIERAWIRLNKTCPDSSSSLSSNSLSLESFWGLFLIAGIASFSALTIYIAIFIYKHRDVLRRLDSNASTWQKLVVLGSQFNQKDLDSHTFKKAEQHDKSCLNDMVRMGLEALPQGNYSAAPSTFSLQASPHTNYPPSPSSFSLQLSPTPHTNSPPSPSSFSNLSIFPGDQGNPTWEHGESNANGQVVHEIMPGVELAASDQERERTSVINCPEDQGN